MKLRDFEYVEAIARLGSFSKAAQELYVSQPALTQSIQRLEDELSLPLFTRVHNGITLTLAGEIFLEDAIEILKIKNRLQKRLSSIDNLNGKTIELGIPQFYGLYLLPDIMIYIEEHYPGIQINLTEDCSANLEKMLDSNKLDFALMPFPLNTNSLQYKTLFNEEIMFVASKELNLDYAVTTMSGALPIIDICKVKKPIVLMKPGQRIRTLSDTMMEELNYHPDIFLETVNLSMIQSVVRKNLAVGLLSSAIPQDPLLNYYHMNSTHNKRKFVIVYKEDNYQAKSSLELIDIIRRALRERLGMAVPM